MTHSQPNIVTTDPLRAARSPAKGYDWVPRGENNSQGAKLKNFYYQYRVLDATSAKTKGYAFRVAV